MTLAQSWLHSHPDEITRRDWLRVGSLSIVGCLLSGPGGQGPLAREQQQAAEQEGVDLSVHRGRSGWKDPLDEWYWLFGNPRRISPQFWYGIDPFLEAALRVNAQTRARLYDVPPPRIVYQKGSRPVLEAVVKEVTKDCTTDAQRAEALLRWVFLFRTDAKGTSGRHLPLLPAQLPAEACAAEHILKAGGGSCEWMTRLYVALAQVAGLPVRLVLRRAHTQAEVYLNGKWLLVDPLMGDHGEKMQHVAKDESAIVRHYLGEQRQLQWLPLTPMPKPGPVRFQPPTTKPAVAESFRGEMLPLRPVPPPPPPTNLSMTHGAWSVKDGRAWLQFGQGYFYHLCQAVLGEESWKDVGIEATVWRRERSDRSALGQSTGAAGIVFRAREQNFNAVLLLDEDSVVVVRIEGGWKTQVLARFPRQLSREGAAKLYVQARGESADIWLEGRYLGGVKQGLWPAGRVGLVGVQSASFADFKVWLEPPALAVPPAPSVLTVTDDCRVLGLLEWDRLLLDVNGPTAHCQPEYSTDSGRTWRPVPADHRLNEVNPRPGRIRFQLRLAPDVGDVRLGVEYRASSDVKPGES